MSIDDDLRHRLAERAASVEPAPDWDDLQTRIGRSRRRRRQAVAAGACALVLLAGVTAIAVWPDDATPPDVRAEDPPERPDETVPHDDADDQGLPPPPLEPRGTYATVWTGRELVVWGGVLDSANMGIAGPDVVYNDGAAYDPDTRQWRTMTESPLSPGDFADGGGLARAVWTGSEVLIVQAERAAAWDPETDRWREVASPPADPDVTGVANTFDGTLGLVAAGDVVIQVHPRSVAAWDPVDDEWSQLPDPPVEIWQGAAVWTGEELVVLGTTSPSGYSGFPQPTEGAAYDPATEQWRTLPSTDLVRTAAATWTGSEVLVSDFDNTRATATYDPAEDEWQALPDVPLASQEGIPSVHMVGETPVMWSFAGSAVLLDGDWVPLSGIDVGFSPVAGAGMLWSIGLDATASPPTMALSAFRPPTSVDELAGLVLRIGFSDLRLPMGFTLHDVEASEQVVGVGVTSRVNASLTGVRGPCQVDSRFGEPADGETLEIDAVDGGTLDAVQLEPGRIDVPDAGTSQHVLEIDCESPEDTEVLARHVVPAADPVALPEADGPPPDDEEAARQAVIEAYSTVYSAETSDEASVAAVDDPRGVADALAQARANFPDAVGVLSVRVDEVRFLNSTEAIVRYDILLPGYDTPEFPDRLGRAVLVDGEWKVTRDTICTDLTLASATCGE